MEEYFNDKKYTIYKTKTKIFSDNKKNKNQNIYFNLNPGYQNNYYYNKTNQNFFPYSNNINNNYSQYNLNNNTHVPTYIPFNVINNNISSNDRIYQKYYYINERNSPLKNYSSNNNRAYTTHDRNFLDEGIMESPNIQNENNFEENDYMNKTTGFKILKRTLSSYNDKYKLLGRYKTNNTDSKIDKLSFIQNNKHYINIYRNKLVKVFVLNINKIMEKNRKKEIMKIFYNNLKKIYYSKRKRINYLNKELNQNAPKYNEYKDMIYNYIKSKNNLPMSKIYNMLKPQDRISFSTINTNGSKNKEKNYNNNNENIKVNKKDIERFKKMQKKYGNIYESKKKEIISFENKIKNYINHRTIESSSSTNNDNDLFKNNFNINTPNINAYKTKNIFKRKKRLNSKSSSKSYKTTSEIRNKYNIYIVKNIISSDKRLFLNINYINLENYNSLTKFYTNDMLKISDLIDINLLGSKYSKNTIGKHKKKLSKIEEEIDDKINSNLSMSIKDNNKFFEKKEEKGEEDNKLIKSNIFNNKVYNSKKIGLSGIRRKYINYKTLKDKEN